MKKRFVPIYSILAIAIVLLAALAPSCGGGATTGTIVVQATLCGTPWQGAVNYTLTLSGGPSPVSGTGVPTTHSNMTPGTWACAYNAGGPAGTFLNSIQPTASQSLVAGGTITFTLDFELNQDAAIEWLFWTLNGDILQSPGTPDLDACNIIDDHFLQWVKGCDGYNVTMNETSWLKIVAAPGNPGPVFIYVINADCALNKTPAPQGLPAVKKSQAPSINNATAQVGDNFTLMPGMEVTLDVHTVWQLVKGTNYTKSINWLGISKMPFDPLHPNHPCVLFELVAPPGAPFQFQLIPSAHVDLVGSTDVNTGNNDAAGPPLLLNVFVLP